ncbi:MAG: radical SAM protein [Bacteroidales bacterium]|nr:radical SAM protein [Bacteroidales bacterium]
MKLLLVIPPLTQLNTPYPSTACLSGYLRSKGFDVSQTDLGITLVDEIFKPSFLEKVFDQTEGLKLPKPLRRIYNHRFDYVRTITPVMRFLRGQDPSLAIRIANRTLLPEGPRFDSLGDMEWAFGVSGTTDMAQHLCTLYLEDLSDYIRETIDPFFDLIRYAESISSFAPTFDELEDSLHRETTLVDQLMLSLFQKKIEQEEPDVVGFSVPFPGCLYAALRCAKWLREYRPEMKIEMGGGFVNTELRSMSDPRLFDYIDYLTYDDGELPTEMLLRFLDGGLDEKELVRTLYCKEGTLVFSGNEKQNIAFNEIAAPDFEGLEHALYFSMSEMLNPMHRMWTNGKWNKMMVAHGCYWAKCAFCDTSLDYICRYDAPQASVVVDRMQKIMEQTGISGFHFVDEALPPRLLKEVSLEIIERKMVVSFWGNIRFDKSFTPELCSLLYQAGCIAVSGGLEVASDRLLRLMNKGVTVTQVMYATRNLTDAGIMVHAYLMYGFPTETYQETIGALKIVRDMFRDGLLQSAFWHRYAMTAHSPSGKHPETFSVSRTTMQNNPFCNNEVEYEEKFDYDIEKVGEGLKLATYNYMHGLGFEIPLKKWFNFK